MQRIITARTQKGLFWFLIPAGSRLGVHTLCVAPLSRYHAACKSYACPQAAIDRDPGICQLIKLLAIFDIGFEALFTIPLTLEGIKRGLI